MPQNLQVTARKVTDLRPWSRNPRNNDDAAKRLAKTITAHGWTVPILVQAKTDRVIAGHTRLKAAKLLGMDEVPTIALDVSDSKADEIALADNRLGELAEWDESALDDLLRELAGSGVDLSDLAFDDRDLDELFEEETMAVGTDRKGQQAELVLSSEQHETIERAIKRAINLGATSRAEALAMIAAEFDSVG